jgi:diguanylate cyclase
MGGDRVIKNRSAAEEARAYVRLALPIMARQNIPVTPMNYTVWYTYVSGTDGELKTTVDKMIENHEEFSDEVNEELYRRFCAEQDGTELRKVRGDLERVLFTVLKEVTNVTGQTQEYESFVSQSIGALSEDASLQEIQEIISEIIDKTKTLGTFGKATQLRLKEATEALEELTKDFEQVKTEVFVDFLTGIANRKAFDKTLASCVADVASDGEDLSLLLIDVDDFKRFNDEFGHLTGDEILKFVAKKIKETVKGRDLPARFGGDEFAVILPQTPLKGALALGENIRGFFATAKLKTRTTAKNLGTITVTIGAACCRPGESPEDLIMRSDDSLHAAKKAGKNRVHSVAR